MENGDFVKIEFVGRVKDTGEIFDLTDKELAKKEGIYNDKSKYAPSLVIIGSGGVISGVEDQLKTMKVGEKREFEVPYTNAFGKRDPALIKIVSMRKFIENKMNPVPGQFVTIDGATCKIQAVSGGRIRVDFNSPLAGKDLKYEVKLVEKLTEPRTRVEALLESYGIEADTKVEGEKAELKFKKPNPHLEKFVEGLVKEWIKEIKIVSFVKEEKQAANSEESKK